MLEINKYDINIKLERNENAAKLQEHTVVLDTWNLLLIKPSLYCGGFFL